MHHNKQCGFILSNQYLILLSLALLGVFGFLSIYYLIKMPPKAAHNQHISTEYHLVKIAAPIQPIPRIKKIDEEWVQLGKALFNSTLLSKDNTVSCASCHMLLKGGDDGFPVSTGVDNKLGSRNSPTVLNAVFNFRQFWDGRSIDLADQVSGPIHNPVEMGANWPDIIQKLKQDKVMNEAFHKLKSGGVTTENIIKAITTFEESLITPDAPIDLYLQGDMNALSEQQKRGYKKFIDFGCVSCHQGRNIGGNLYQKVGRIGAVPDFLLNEPGRYSVTNNPNDKYVFKVPSLRNIEKTAPYFHNGSVNNLRDAIKIMAGSQLGVKLSEEDVDDLASLLKSFTGKTPQSLR